MTALAVLVAAVLLTLAATSPAPYRGCRRWTPRHQWTGPAHRTTRGYRPRHRAGLVTRPARLPLAIWAAGESSPRASGSRGWRPVPVPALAGAR